MYVSYFIQITLLTLYWHEIIMGLWSHSSSHYIWQLECPFLGFHPQVRWPTRCKRCFRDYKEHSDSGDQKKFANLDSSSTESDPWSVRKSNFQKSKSVDVTIESGGAAASRFASYTTSKDTATTSKTEEDIPEWKKAMLERRRKDRVTNRSFGTIKFRIYFSPPLPTIIVFYENWSKFILRKIWLKSTDFEIRCFSE